MPKVQKFSKIALFQDKRIRSVKMRLRDEQIARGYGQIAHTLYVSTEGGRQKMNCANMKGILRIIQSIPSDKAEPFKIWLPLRLESYFLQVNV